ncbi:unnamed protein product, partial [Ectocarpus sp. 12 AP-2014]
ASQLFNAAPQIDIGVHLTLSSEWEALKWRPLTYAPSLVDEDGYFLPLVMPRDGDNRPCLAEADWSLDEIAAEFRAQIELSKHMFVSVTHVSAHMVRHFKELAPKAGDCVAALCAEYGLLDDPLGDGLPRIKGYPNFPRNTQKRIAAFADRLSELAPGPQVFIDHPGAASTELDETGHVGYEDVALDRTTCLETLTSPVLQKRIHELDIELISYK